MIRDENVSRQELYQRMTSAITDVMELMAKESRLRAATEAKNRWLLRDLKRERERHGSEERRLQSKILQLEDQLFLATAVFDDDMEEEADFGGSSSAVPDENEELDSGLMASNGADHHEEGDEGDEVDGGDGGDEGDEGDGGVE
ncbi:hypothetical protein FQN60_001664 [Etheostoma spectabile]|uniref:Uncharacterized protein n=1 Tax=Etheostoma spectabile TaxID=54343 RepID=A0A5J5C779_9PERO|nr:hypothetical protein FQN60_001664 [Etheostoma spectabile]